MMHYCGARVSAVRHGKYKAHFSTTVWENDDEFCIKNVICSCHGKLHDPPLLYNIHEDPAEQNPLDTNTTTHARVLDLIKVAKKQHEDSILPVPSQTEIFPFALSHLPCCGAEPGTFDHAWKVMFDKCGC